jgi:hypothetical protein
MWRKPQCAVEHKLAFPPVVVWNAGLPRRKAGILPADFEVLVGSGSCCEKKQREPLPPGRRRSVNQWRKRRCLKDRVSGAPASCRQVLNFSAPPPPQKQFQLPSWKPALLPHAPSFRCESRKIPPRIHFLSAESDIMSLGMESRVLAAQRPWIQFRKSWRMTEWFNLPRSP